MSSARPSWLPPLVALLVVLHLNFWMWTDARILWGFPANLLYHVALCLALSLVMLFVVRRAWPRQLDEE